MTYKTFLCPRTYRDTPYVGDNHWCIDCLYIRVKRRIKFWWSER